MALSWSSRRLKQKQAPQVGRQGWKALPCSQRMLTRHRLRLRCVCLGTQCQHLQRSKICMPPHLPRLCRPAKTPHTWKTEVCPLSCAPQMQFMQDIPHSRCSLSGDRRVNVPRVLANVELKLWQRGTWQGMSCDGRRYCAGQAETMQSESASCALPRQPELRNSLQAAKHPRVTQVRLH